MLSASAAVAVDGPDFDGSVGGRGWAGGKRPRPCQKVAARSRRLSGHEEDRAGPARQGESDFGAFQNAQRATRLERGGLSSLGPGRAPLVGRPPGSPLHRHATSAVFRVSDPAPSAAVHPPSRSPAVSSAAGGPAWAAYLRHGGPGPVAGVCVRFAATVNVRTQGKIDIGVFDSPLREATNDARRVLGLPGAPPGWPSPETC